VQYPTKPTIVVGSPASFSRRSCLQIGAAGIAGLTLADMLRADALSGAQRRKSLIHIVLRGGPSQLDTFDLKPEAPREIRGEFNPIDTVVPASTSNSWRSS